MNEKKFSLTMAVIYIIIAACLIVGTTLFMTQGSQDNYSITVDGYMGPLTVEVSIKDGLITGAKVTESAAGEFLPQSADAIFAQAIESGNADSIDIVAGASATSNALIKALQQAIVEAGVYITSAEGRAGSLTVKTTIKDGVIIDATVSDYPEGERIPETAEIITKAIEQGNANGIDVVAGASMTSRALISALQQAYIKANTDSKGMIGYGEGYKGPLSVQVFLEGEKIVAAELLTLSDSAFSLPTAEELLTKAVTEGSADNLDIIAGATSTSTGVITALRDAVAK